ncbi:MAG: XRE family transcriptional regulator [Treponema sp.]|jgi:quercetin dioxygenase-like cupin family protein/DNA-binding XRE family transcriptional regulator|nr:XRE family transcriptional regulator [Treponema sp.]
MTSNIKDIIQRVEVLREIADISAETLAHHLGFDKEEYRQWESGTVDFPVGVLIKIADYFNVDLADLMQGASSRLKTYCVTRAGEAPEVSRRPMYSYWNLAYTFHRKKAEPFLVVVQPDTAVKPFALNTHSGQEFDYVLEGKIQISVGGHEIELGPGDSIYYDSQEPHGMRAVGEASATFLAIVF